MKKVANVAVAKPVVKAVKTPRAKAKVVDKQVDTEVVQECTEEVCEAHIPEPEVSEQEVCDSIETSKRITPLSSNEFGQKLKEITDAIAHLAVLEDALAQQPKGSALRYKDDIQIHRRDITSFRTTIKNEVSDLRKVYDTALKYRKKLKPANPRSVRFLRKLNPVARELLCSSKAGLGKFENVELHTKFPLFAKEGLVLNTTIMYLTSIFTRKNKLGENGTSLVATSQMVNLLTPYHSELDSKGFKFNDFKTTQWTTILSSLKEEMSKADRESIMEANKDQLFAEEAIARKVLENLK